MTGAPASGDAEVQVATALTRIETKLDTVLTGHEDHEKRIRSLERAVWIAAGGAGTVSAIVTNFLSSVKAS